MTAVESFARILAVTDLGPAGRRAVRAAALRAQATDASLAVVHAMPSIEMVRPIFTERVVEDALRRAGLPQQALRALDQHLAACGEAAAAAELILDSGGTAEVGLAAADRWDADLIVTGAPEGALDTERIVRHARVPVLVVRDEPARGAVIACTDFSDPSLPAVRAAADEARRTGDRLFVVHALEPLPSTLFGVEGFGIVSGAEWMQTRRAAAERRLAGALADCQVAGEYVAVDGPVVSALVGIARDRGARLMVIGTVGRTGLTRFLLGSVAESLVRSAPCSTLVVRLRRG